MRYRVGISTRAIVVTGVVFIALAFSFVGISTVRERRLLQVYGEQGSLDRSWIEHREPNFIEQLIGLPGKPFAVTLRGDDPAIVMQVEAIQDSNDLQAITFDSVRANALPDDGIRLPEVRELSFSNCEGDAVEVLLSSASATNLIRIFNSGDLSDNALKGQACLAEVKAIELDGTDVSGIFLKDLHTAKKLSSVVIRYSPVAPEALQYLVRVPEVTYVEIDSPTSGISYHQAEVILGAMKSTVEIVLGGFEE